MDFSNKNRIFLQSLTYLFHAVYLCATYICIFSAYFPIFYFTTAFHLIPTDGEVVRRKVIRHRGQLKRLFATKASVVRLLVHVQSAALREHILSIAPALPALLQTLFTQRTQPQSLSDVALS